MYFGEGAPAVCRWKKNWGMGDGEKKGFEKGRWSRAVMETEGISTRMAKANSPSNRRNTPQYRRLRMDEILGYGPLDT